MKAPSPRQRALVNLSEQYTGALNRILLDSVRAAVKPKVETTLTLTFTTDQRMRGCPHRFVIHSTTSGHTEWQACERKRDHAGKHWVTPRHYPNVRIRW